MSALYVGVRDEVRAVRTEHKNPMKSRQDRATNLTRPRWTARMTTYLFARRGTSCTLRLLNDVVLFFSFLLSFSLVGSDISSTAVYNSPATDPFARQMSANQVTTTLIPSKPSWSRIAKQRALVQCSPPARKTWQVCSVFRRLRGGEIWPR